jgi:diguanylate cyclase (GGDEF)-like protein
MRAAAILERAWNGLAIVPPYGFSVGGFVAAGLLAALGWVWPSIGVGLILLVACGCQIASLRRRVRKLTDRDSLTGAASRTCFYDALRRAVRNCSRSGAPLVVAVLDCDDFKQINERFGHPVGDAVLIEVAEVLMQMLAGRGTAGRIWGDAFGILLPGLPLEPARSLLRETDQRLQAHMTAHGWPVTFSIGVSCLDGTVANADGLLSNADALMFAVKRRGRNGIASKRPHEESSKAAEPPSEVRSADASHPDAVCPPSPEFARQP